MVSAFRVTQKLLITHINHDSRSLDQHNCGDKIKTTSPSIGCSGSSSKHEITRTNYEYITTVYSCDRVKHTVPPPGESTTLYCTTKNEDDEL